MQLHLEGRHVLITGGSKGIGLACAKSFLQEGCRVTLVARDGARLEQAQQQLASPDRVAIVAADLSQAAERVRVGRHGPHPHQPRRHPVPPQPTVPYVRAPPLRRARTR